MKQVKKTAEYTISQKSNKRYAVQDANKKIINGEDKVKILLAEGLIKASAPGKKKEAPAEAEAASEEAPVEK